MKKYSAKKYIGDQFTLKAKEIVSDFRPEKVKMDMGYNGVFLMKESFGLKIFFGLTFSPKDYFKLEIRWDPNEFPEIFSQNALSALPLNKIIEGGYSPDFELKSHGLEAGNLTRSHQNISFDKTWDVPNVFNEKHLERRKPKLDGIVEECCDIVKTAFLPYISLFEKYLATKPSQNDGSEPQT